MPYNPSTGVYTLPAVYLAVPGTVIVATQHNTPLTDLQTAQNYERPIIAGGTGAGTAAGARTALGVPASATTPSYTAPTVDNEVVRWDGVAGAQQGSPLVVTDAATGAATLTATNDGATGAVLTLDHESTSPAASDIIGRIAFVGEDSAGNDETYAYIEGVINDPTSTSEDSTVRIVTRTAGSNNSPVSISAAAVEAPNGFLASGVRVGGAPDAVLEDQKAAGTNGGNSTSGSWQTRTLNTEVRDVSNLITLSSNEFTPTVAGWVEWSAPAFESSSHQTRLYNVTDAAVTKAGSSENIRNDTTSQTRSFGGCAVVAGKAYRVEHRVGTSKSGGYGSAANFGETEVYTRVLFWRTA